MHSANEINEIRVDILQQGIELTTRDRQNTYGNFTTNMDLLGTLFRLYYANGGNKYSSAHNAAIFHVLAKISRVAVGNLHKDNYVDAAVYLAAAYEAEVLVNPQPFPPAPPEVPKQTYTQGADNYMNAIYNSVD